MDWTWMLALIAALGLAIYLGAALVLPEMFS